MTHTGCELSAAQSALDALTAFGRADADLLHAVAAAKADQGSIVATNEAVAKTEAYIAAFRTLRRLARQITDGTVVDT